MAEMPPTKVGFFRDSKDFVVHEAPGLSMNYLLLNLKDPHLKRKEVREALASAIHREENHSV